jgi:hypothetical protein
MADEENETPISLSEQLDSVLATYENEQGSLNRFVHDIEGWIEGHSEKTESIIVKLDWSIREEKPLGSATGVQLSPDEAQALRPVMDIGRDALARYPTMILNMALIYAVALFEAYMFDALTAVLKARPEMLKSRKKQITFETVVLAEAQGTPLVPVLASRELGEVSYKSFDDQAVYYRERFGMRLEDSGVALKDLREVTARRNLWVHNAGAVNSRYLETAPDSPFQVGERADVDAEYWGRAQDALTNVASFAARSLNDKFTDDSA